MDVIVGSGVTYHEIYAKWLWRHMDEIVHDYYEIGGAQVVDGMPKLDIDWEQLKNVENAGLLYITGAMRSRKLVGFAMYVLTNHLHHKHTRMALSDILALDYSMRGLGVGLRMVQHAEGELKRKGVQFVTHQFRTCYNVEPLFPKLGYRLIEQTYIKEL
jgi:GNAT superfamily N-acetyltransferase